MEQMSVAGKAKVRHVGGWVIKKILESSRKYVQRNMFSLQAETSRSVRRHFEICELMDENLVTPFAKLESTKFKDTLQVTEARQSRRRG